MTIEFNAYCIDSEGQKVGIMSIECDECGDYDEKDGTWKECFNALKEEGWKVKYHGDSDYCHYCPECSK